MPPDLIRIMLHILMKIFFHRLVFGRLSKRVRILVSLLVILLMRVEGETDLWWAGVSLATMLSCVLRVYISMYACTYPT